jgi:hypothetical protein
MTEPEIFALPETLLNLLNSCLMYHKILLGFNSVLQLLQYICIYVCVCVCVIWFCLFCRGVQGAVHKRKVLLYLFS